MLKVFILVSGKNLCFSGTNQKPERRPPFGTGLVRHCPQGLFSPFFTFLRSIYIFPPVYTFPRPHYLPLGLRGWLEGTARLSVFLTIMDKSPWDSHNVASILCVSQLLSQKAVVSFYKCMSPSPSPPNTMLKDQRNCALTVSTLSVGWGEGVGTCSVSSARIQFRVC